MIGATTCKRYGCKIKVKEIGAYCGIHSIVPRKKNKFNAVSSVYNNYRYDSKLEAGYAMKLDWLKKAKEIRGWDRQHKIEFVINETLVGTYLIDFRVMLNDGRVEYHEVKGAETSIWRLKWKIAKALYPDRVFVLIKKY